MQIKPIRIESDYQRVLKMLDELMDARPNTPEGDRLDILATLAEAWEREHYPIAPTTA
jgi:HTH-type transcriptional regulator/antitoxin HigA